MERIILHYLGGLSVNTRVLIRGQQEDSESEEKAM